MMTSPPVSQYVIRDAQEVDIPACLALDRTYETGSVWQLAVHQDEVTSVESRFRRERLPRTLTITPPPLTAAQMRAGLHDNWCFLVAEARNNQAIIGYLRLRADLDYGIGVIQTVAVDSPQRRKRIGTRLVNAARLWARERQLLDVQMEISTKNYPAIEFAHDLGFSFCGFNDRYLPGREIAVFFNQSIR